MTLNISLRQIQRGSQETEKRHTVSLHHGVSSSNKEEQFSRQYPGTPGHTGQYKELQGLSQVLGRPSSTSPMGLSPFREQMGMNLAAVLQ